MSTDTPHLAISNMSARNRKKPDAKEPHSPAESEAPAVTSKSAEPVKKTKKRSLGLTFAIGGIAGLLLAGFAAKNQDMQFISDLRLDSLIDVIPAGILKEATEISVRSPSLRNSWRRGDTNGGGGGVETRERCCGA